MERCVGRHALAICVVGSLLAGCSSRRSLAETTLPLGVDSVSVRRFGMYSFGASGVAALPDGRVVIAEDERLHPLVLVDLFGRQPAKEFTPLEVAAAFAASGVTWLNDLEGITISPAGHLYATTSHALPRSGISLADRQLVVRFDLEGNRIVHAAASAALARAIAALDTGLAAAESRMTKTRGPSPGLNIEAIAWDPERNRLLIGLRGPLRNDRAIVVGFENPDEVFDLGAPPRLSGPYFLPLDGQGIRDMTWAPDLGAFLVVAGSSGMSAFGHSALWMWTGPGSAAPVHLRASVLDPLKPEGVALMTVRGHRIALFVCDDGVLDNKFYTGRVAINRGTPSRYVVLPMGILQRDNPDVQWMPQPN